MVLKFLVIVPDKIIIGCELSNRKNGGKKMMERTKADWEKIVGDQPISFEKRGSFYYARGSELACLRLSYAYRGCKNFGLDYNKLLDVWSFWLCVPGME
jgi:hypothetical protein